LQNTESNYKHHFDKNKLIIDNLNTIIDNNTKEYNNLKEQVHKLNDNIAELTRKQKNLDYMLKNQKGEMND